MKLKIFLCSIVLSLGLLLPGCGSDETKDNPAPVVATNFNDLLRAGDRREFVGRNVNFDNVPVDQVVGTYVFWAGTSRTGIPVFRKDRLEGRATEHVKRGDKVRIDGTVRLVEPLSATDPLWDHVSANEKEDILAAKVYVVANTVQIIH